MSIFYGGKHQSSDSLGVRITNDYVDEDRVRQIIQRFTTPEIGQLKFLLLPSINDDFLSCFSLEYDGSYRLNEDNDFDGWVYPDGKRYLKDDFPDAFDQFDNDGERVFAVPEFRDFLRGNVGGVTGDSTKWVNFSNPVAKHNHAIEKSKTTTGVVDNCFDFYVTSGYSSDGNLFNKDDPTDSIRVHNKS